MEEGEDNKAKEKKTNPENGFVRLTAGVTRGWVGRDNAL